MVFFHGGLMVSLARVIFINPAETGNHLILTCFVKKTFQSARKFIGTLSCRIDIGNAYTFVALRKRLIVFPCNRVCLNSAQNSFRKNIRRTNEINYAFPYLWMNQPPVRQAK